MTETEGIPQLIDLTHIQDLLASGKYLLMAFLLALALAALYGIVLALLGRSTRVPDSALSGWVRDYAQGLKVLQHAALVGWLLAGTFVIGSTLANRYHHWEQAQIQKQAQTVSGARLEQQSPTVRYLTPRRRTVTQYVDGQPKDVSVIENVPNYLNLAASDLQVKIAQFTRPEQGQTQTERLGYSVDFQGLYTVTNTLSETRTFFFDAYIPREYSLLEGFKVERDGQNLVSDHQSERSFKFSLKAGESAKFRLSYKAQGDPRWVYTAHQSLLSNFKLNLETNFSSADFASGIAPTRTETAGSGKRLVWEFKDNVSVQNPFGVFTAVQIHIQTGILPRLLLLSPVILLLWLLLLYLTVPRSPLQVLASGGLFIAALVSLTYLSRLIEPLMAWPLLSLFVAAMIWLQHRGHRWQALLGTLTALLLPVFALMTRYAGLFLGLAALLSILWLTLHLNRTVPEASSLEV